MTWWQKRGPEVVLAKRVRQLRQARGWSQEQLAGRLNLDFGYSMHQTTVAKIEAAARPIRLNEAAAIALIFEVELNDLVYQPTEKDNAELQEIEQQMETAKVEMLTAQSRTAHAQDVAAHAQQRAAEAQAAAARALTEYRVIESRFDAVLLRLEEVAERVQRGEEA